MDSVNAFVDAGAAAVEHGARGPLSGLSLAVKDIFDVEGLKTGAGNPFRAAEQAPAERTAPAVQRLLDAGARFAGKTQTEELAFSLLGNNCHYPRPINPAAPDRFTGGSSSGSAATVAAGLVDIACGSDTAGSICAPASFCGLLWLRMTHGALSLDGAVGLAPSFDSFGWFTRDLATYRLVADVLLPAARLFRIRHVLRAASLAALASSSAEYRGLIGVVEGGLEPTDPMEVPYSPPELAGAMCAIQGFEAWQLHGRWVTAHAGDMGADALERFRLGSSLTVAEHDAATRIRTAFSAFLRDALGDDGVLLLPTVPSAAPRVFASADELAQFRPLALQLLRWAPLAGLPQLHLPLGRVDGAPWGVSLLGLAGCDRGLLEAASAFVSHFPAG